MLANRRQCRSRLSHRIAMCATALVAAMSATWGRAGDTPPHPPYTYPPALAEALLRRQAAEAAAAQKTPYPAAFAFVSKNYLWPAGQRLIVAFHGGRYEVWRDIATIADQWSTVANVTFDFGLDPKAKTARMWDPLDPTAEPAHVRVRLDESSASIRYAAVGREAFLKEFNDGSLVLGGVALIHPLWSAEDRADILHEFGHVLGFLHEQQRPECQKEFRLEKGLNGEPTIYELYEKLYQWGPEKTQANLLLAASYKAESMGLPDKKSLFMYPTEDIILSATLHGTKGPCYVKRKNLMLSKGDIERARKDYPFNTDNTIVNLASSNIETLKQLAGATAGELATAPLLQRLEHVERALRPLVYIQVASAEQRPSGEALRKRLQGGGYIAPAMENIDGKAIAPREVEVRYFSAADEAQAQAVANLVQEELGGTPVSTRMLTRKQERKLPLEVWLPKVNQATRD